MYNTNTQIIYMGRCMTVRISRDKHIRKKKKTFFTNSNDKFKNDSSLQPRKKRARRGVRYQMELNFDTEEAKHALLSRIDSATRYLAPKASFLDNAQLLLVVGQGGLGSSEFFSHW